MSIRVSSGKLDNGRTQSTAPLTANKARTFVVKAADGPLVARFVVNADDSGADVTVKATPFAIVRVNNLGKGRTPLKLRLKKNEAARVLLKSPRGGEVEATIRFRP